MSYNGDHLGVRLRGEVDLQGVGEVKWDGGVRGEAVTSSLTRQNTLARAHVASYAIRKVR